MRQAKLNKRGNPTTIDSYRVVDKRNPNTPLSHYVEMSMWVKYGTTFEGCKVQVTVVPLNEQKRRLETQESIELRAPESPTNSRITDYEAYIKSTNEHLKANQQYGKKAVHRSFQKGLKLINAQKIWPISDETRGMHGWDKVFGKSTDTELQSSPGTVAHMVSQLLTGKTGKTWSVNLNQVDSIELGVQITNQQTKSYWPMKCEFPLSDMYDYDCTYDSGFIE